jgi:alkaline phosphatase D
VAPPAPIFAHGVASGDPTATGVVLWTRVEPGRTVRWAVATDPDVTSVVASGSIVSAAEDGGCVHVDVDGLEPATPYWYRFDVDGSPSPVGRTRTARAAGDPGEIRLGVVSCSAYAAGPFLAFAGLAERDVDAVVHLGDVIYDVDGGPRVRDPSPDESPRDLEGYRTRHAQARTDADFQAVLRRHPLIATWDDHDVAGNSWRGGADHHDPERDGPWEDRRAAALRAWREWLPIRLPDTAAPERIWRSLPLGGAAELLVLDTRHDGRDRQVDADDPDPAAAVRDPARNLVSPAQREWLHGSLRASTAAWRVLANQVVLSPIPFRLPDPVPEGIGRAVGLVVDGAVVNADQWDGYVAERDRLLPVLASVGPTLVLTGDVHSSWALDVPGAGAAVEAVVPAVTSQSFASIVGADNVVLAGLLVQVLGEQLDHLHWTELRSPGYAVVSITPDRVQTDWWHVDLTGATPERLAASWTARADGPRWAEATGPLGDRSVPAPPPPPGPEAAPPAPRPSPSRWPRVGAAVAGVGSAVAGAILFRRRRR